MFKNVQIPKGAVNEHDRLTLAAFKVMGVALLISIAWISEPHALF